MTPRDPLPPDLALRVAEVTGALGARVTERIQTLWGGYGELVRVDLGPCSAVVKWARPPATARAEELSHARKCRSYDVETAWYRSFAPRCDDACRVASLLGSRVGAGEWLLALEDLDAAGFSGRYGRRGGALPSALADRCLAWLAALHARFLGAPPQGLWESGTYWHLATRPDELRAIEDERLRAAAPVLDGRLRACAFQTLVHGDAKLANFCFAADGSAVAAVDFQYAGGGCGVKDVAYFLSSCSSDGRELADPARLDAYFAHLRYALERYAPSVDGRALERAWRELYPIACADFFRFLAGWSKAAWANDACGQRVTADVLRSIARD